MTIEVSRIGLIKTKRSAGRSIFLGAVIGAGTGTILGLATGGEDEIRGQGDGAAGFGLIMGVMGSGIGAITSIFKKSDTYDIKGDTTKWKAFREVIDP